MSYKIPNLSCCLRQETCSHNPKTLEKIATDLLLLADAMQRLDLETAISQIRQACIQDEFESGGIKPFFFVVGAGVSAPVVPLSAQGRGKINGRETLMFQPVRKARKHR